MLSIFTLRLVFLLLYTFVLSCNFRCAYSLVNNPVASFPRANPVPNVQLTDPSAEINRKRKCCAHVSPTMFFSREKKAPLHKLHYFSRSPLRLQMNGAPSWIPWPGRFFSLLISCSIAYSKTHPLHVLENSHQQRPDNRHRPRHPAPTRTLQVLLGEGKYLLPKASLFPPSPCVIPPSRPPTPRGAGRRCAGRGYTSRYSRSLRTANDTLVRRPGRQGLVSFAPRCPVPASQSRSDCAAVGARRRRAERRDPPPRSRVG